MRNGRERISTRILVFSRMSSPISRIARLTLFSGPNCSLCDIAKAELAKARQRRPFQLETINIQDKGQEKWKKKYVYWIPALHIEGKEVAKGRWDAKTVDQALAAWEQNPWVQESQQSNSYLYERVGETVLGLEEGTNTSDLDSRRCFNCGSLDHIIASCPELLNHALITLSRQLYKFFRNDTLGEFRRFYEVEECKQQRLRWLEEFEPGHIRGPSLREALALRDGDVGENVEWLRNMACWGYPTGWIGITDPREHVQKIISGDSHETNNYSEDDDSFVIVGDEDEEWLVLPTKLKESSSDNDRSGSDESLGPVSNTSSSRSTTPTACVLAQRWAVYPDTYFLWSRLPAYNGFSLPALGSEVNSPPVSSTYTPDRQELWNSIVSQHFIASARDNSSRPSFVGSYSISGCPQSASFPPAPPTTPPPLPPSPYHTRPPPGLDGTVPRSTHNVQDQVVDTEDDIDMDLSE